MIQRKEMLQEKNQNIQNSSIQRQKYKFKNKSLIKMAHCGVNWTFQESYLYVQFLKENRRYFKNDFTKRSSKIFLQMSLYLSSKSARQCRTYHKTMITKFKNLKNIENYLLKCIKGKQISEQIISPPSNMERINQGSFQIVCKKNKIHIFLDMKSLDYW